MSVLQYLKSGDGNFGAQAPRCLSACGSGQRDGGRRCRSHGGEGGYAMRIGHIIWTRIEYADMLCEYAGGRFHRGEKQTARAAGEGRGSKTPLSSEKMAPHEAFAMVRSVSAATGSTVKCDWRGKLS